MKWFQGNINAAVATSKSRKAIFVVFVEGKDEASLKIAKLIDSPEISSRLEQDDFVAVKLEGGSEAYGFFSQIYQLVPIPSLFFIGQNGAPLEVIAGETSAADLTAKIESVLKKVDPTSPKDSSTSFIQSEQQESAGSSGSLKTSETEISTIDLDAGKSETSMAPVPAISKPEQDQETKVIAQGKSSASSVGEPEAKTSPKKSDGPSTSGAVSEGPKIPELTAEEKVERARQLIELQKRQREEEEAKKIREREIQRRKSGQEMLRIKQQQQDLEIKQAHEERIREKAAEAAARDKVRQQIAQDKLERKQRAIDLQKQKEYAQQSPVQEQPKPRTPNSSDSNVARIQFRLPSGTPHMGQFDSTSTLGDLRTYVVQNIELPFRHFALSTSFPRRELTVKDDDKTLVELELVPTSVILILPFKNATSITAVTSAQDNGYLSRFMWTIYASIISVYSYIRGYFIRPPPSAGQQNPGTASGGVQPSTSSADRPISRPGQGGSPAPGLLRRNLGGLGSTTIRAQGNVHRLHSGGDQDNDENNTWNGNSTQQM